MKFRLKPRNRVFLYKIPLHIELFSTKLQNSFWLLAIHTPFGRKHVSINPWTVPTTLCRPFFTGGANSCGPQNRNQEGGGQGSVRSIRPEIRNNLPYYKNKESPPNPRKMGGEKIQYNLQIYSKVSESFHTFCLKFLKLQIFE